MESSEHEDSVSVSVSLPIDSDGFFRRACAECGREFKLFAEDSDEQDSAEDAAEPVQFCPYCRAVSGDWITKAQFDWAMAQATNQVLEPMVDEFADNVNSDSEFLQIAVDWTPAEAEKPLEPNDMVRVDFDCHPEEPAKILDGWVGAVHCHICGTIR